MKDFSQWMTEQAAEKPAVPILGIQPAKNGRMSLDVHLAVQRTEQGVAVTLMRHGKVVCTFEDVALNVGDTLTILGFYLDLGKM